MHSRSRTLLVAAAAVCLFTPASSHAELVLLRSGQTMEVSSHRVVGETIVLQMRRGGEITCDRTLVDRIVPDEVQYEDPSAEGPTVQPPARESTPPTGPYAEIITSLAQAHGVDPMLVSAVIQVESNYRATARSRKGAMGLMQLMPSTARQYNVRNPYDPKANIAAGVKHLKGLIDRWGVELALAAYNAGEGAVKKFNGIPPYRETRNYVSKILSLAGLR